MNKAIELAKEAYKRGEIPVGAVIVMEGNIIASSFNRNREMNNPTRHAEMIAIENAASFLKNERLTGCDIYVTKEPCSMCAGAIVHARLEKVIIGAKDNKYGACGTVLNICGNRLLNHRPEIEFGILQEESEALLKRFFLEKRGKKQANF